MSMEEEATSTTSLALEEALGPDHPKNKDEALFYCQKCKQELVADRSKLFPCFHPVCTECVNDCVGASNCQCPICHYQCADFNELIDYKILPVLLADAKNSDNGSGSGADRTPQMCTSCDDRPRATAHCEECGDYLCNTCRDAHKRVKITKDHNVQPLAAADEEDQLQLQSCREHPTETLTLICLQCNVHTCRTCQLKNHKGHEHQWISDRANQHRSALSEKVPAFAENQKRLEDFILEVQAKKMEILDKRSRAKSEVKTAVNQVQKAVSRRADVLLREIDMTAKRKKQVFLDFDKKLARLIAMISQARYVMNMLIQCPDNQGIVNCIPFVNSHCQRIETEFTELSREATAPNSMLSRPVTMGVVNLDVMSVERAINLFGTVLAEGQDRSGPIELERPHPAAPGSDPSRGSTSDDDIQIVGASHTQQSRSENNCTSEQSNNSVYSNSMHQQQQAGIGVQQRMSPQLPHGQQPITAHGPSSLAGHQPMVTPAGNHQGRSPHRHMTPHRGGSSPKAPRVSTPGQMPQQVGPQHGMSAQAHHYSQQVQQFRAQQPNQQQQNQQMNYNSMGMQMQSQPGWLQQSQVHPSQMQQQQQMMAVSQISPRTVPPGYVQTMAAAQDQRGMVQQPIRGAGQGQPPYGYPTQGLQQRMGQQGTYPGGSPSASRPPNHMAAAGYPSMATQLNSQQSGSQIQFPQAQASLNQGMQMQGSHHGMPDQPMQMLRQMQMAHQAAARGQPPQMATQAQPLRQTMNPSSGMRPMLQQHQAGQPPGPGAASQRPPRGQSARGRRGRGSAQVGGAAMGRGAMPSSHSPTAPDFQFYNNPNPTVVQQSRDGSHFTQFSHSSFQPHRASPVQEQHPQPNNNGQLVSTPVDRFSLSPVFDQFVPDAQSFSDNIPQNIPPSQAGTSQQMAFAQVQQQQSQAFRTSPQGISVESNSNPGRPPTLEGSLELRDAAAAMVKNAAVTRKRPSILSNSGNSPTSTSSSPARKEPRLSDLGHVAVSARSSPGTSCNQPPSDVAEIASDKTFSCAECPAVFVKRRHLIKHGRLAHDHEYFCCPHCSIQFTRFPHVRRHCVRAHPTLEMPTRGETRAKNLFSKNPPGLGNNDPSVSPVVANPSHDPMERDHGSPNELEVPTPDQNERIPELVPEENFRGNIPTSLTDLAIKDKDRLKAIKIRDSAEVARRHDQTPTSTLFIPKPADGEPSSPVCPRQRRVSANEYGAYLQSQHPTAEKVSHPDTTATTGQNLSGISSSTCATTVDGIIRGGTAEEMTAGKNYQMNSDAIDMADRSIELAHGISLAQSPVPATSPASIEPGFSHELPDGATGGLTGWSAYLRENSDVGAKKAAGADPQPPESSNNTPVRSNKADSFQKAALPSSLDTEASDSVADVLDKADAVRSESEPLPKNGESTASSANATTTASSSSNIGHPESAAIAVPTVSSALRNSGDNVSEEMTPTPMTATVAAAAPRTAADKKPLGLRLDLSPSQNPDSPTSPGFQPTQPEIFTILDDNDPPPVPQASTSNTAARTVDVSEEPVLMRFGVHSTRSESVSPMAPDSTSQRSDKSDKDWDDYCSVCHNGGELLCCENCPRVYHGECHIPQLSKAPEGSWYCGFCITPPKEKPPPGVARDAISLDDNYLQICQRILLQSFSADKAQPFQRPVDEEKDCAPSYYQIIVKPMDLLTIRTKLSRVRSRMSGYQHVIGFIKDMNQLFINCAIYNEQSSEMAQLGREMAYDYRQGVSTFMPTFISAVKTEPTLAEVQDSCEVGSQLLMGLEQAEKQQESRDIANTASTSAAKDGTFDDPKSNPTTDTAKTGEPSQDGTASSVEGPSHGVAPPIRASPLRTRRLGSIVDDLRMKKEKLSSLHFKQSSQ